MRSLVLAIASEVAVGTTPEPPRGGVGRLFSPLHSLHPGPIPGQHPEQSRGHFSSTLPRPGHLLPRSCHSRLPRPHPPACLGPRWGPTLRARAPQRPRKDETQRPPRGKRELGGRCKQLMERRAGRVERSGAPGPPRAPPRTPPRILSNHALKQGSAPVRSRAPPLASERRPSPLLSPTRRSTERARQ